MFLSETEKALTDEYCRQGYVIRPVANRPALEWIRERFVHLSSSILGSSSMDSGCNYLDHIHEHVGVRELNQFRLSVINDINSEPNLRQQYFSLAQPYLEALVGNELAMQMRINVSIQLPSDDGSLLEVHADTWSGDSAFEVVVWLPLVDCYGTKSMYIVTPERSRELSRSFSNTIESNAEQFFDNIADDARWLDVRYGEVLVFDQSLPHGNRINEELETRWSLNCRFKGLFTPYGDKKLGEFFEPISLRAASRNGMNYRHPKV